MGKTQMIETSFISPETEKELQEVQAYHTKTYKKIDKLARRVLKNDVEYHGRMIDADSHMNIILEGATEFRGNTATANYGNIILRGSNILYIAVEAGRQQA